MQCERCNGEVTWRGPFSDLTHTECSSCGGINCQRVAGQDEPDDSDMNQVHAGGVDMTALPVAQQAKDFIFRGVVHALVSAG